MEAFLKDATEMLARAAEGIAAVVIAAGILRAFLMWIVDQFTNRTGETPREGIRLTLGRSLALALEFELGADILGTAVTPTWDQIARLAAIAAIRTALNFFLQRELRDAEQMHQAKVQANRGDELPPERA